MPYPTPTATTGSVFKSSPMPRAAYRGGRGVNREAERRRWSKRTGVCGVALVPRHESRVTEVSLFRTGAVPPPEPP